MMDISKRNIIIACVATLAVIIIVIVVLSRSGPTHKSAIFEQCNGYSGPIEYVEIESCSNITKLGYCEIKIDSDTWVKMNLTLAKDFDFLRVDVIDPSDELATDFYDCEEMGSCRFGEKIQMRFPIGSRSFKRAESGQVKFNVYHEGKHSNEQVYCVQFPAKIV